MKTTKKDECSYSVSNAIRTLAMLETGMCKHSGFCVVEK